MDALPQRKIIHVDMDAFFASVAQLDNPELKGKAIAVGGSSDRGVIAAASYEARKFGVKSAMASSIAARRCPHLIFVKHDFARYKELSLQIREIFYEYTDLVEPLSLDEAFLDVTENKKGLKSATLIAKEIRKQILEKTGLTASAGISINKFTAKIASDINKPNGQKTITPEEIEPFLEQLPISKFFGVGKVTAEKMKKTGIFYGKDLKSKSEKFLSERFGKAGRHYHRIVRGIHLTPVKPHRQRKSVGIENTYSEDLETPEDCIPKLEELSIGLTNRLLKSNFKGRTITLKIKYSDFKTQTRSYTPEEVIDFNQSSLLDLGKELLNKESLRTSVRLLGLSISNEIRKEKVTEKKAIHQLTLNF